MGPIDFHSKHFSLLIPSQWGPSTVWLLTFFKIACVQQKKKLHTCLEGESMMTEFSFLSELSF